MDAIRMRGEVAIEYWTMSGKPASRRVISPHSLAFGTGRWHIRAWNKENGDFRDFNLSRIAEAELVGSSGVDPTLDYEWSMKGQLLLRANPALKLDEQDTVRHDFEFEGEELAVDCRLALLFYVKAQYFLDASGSADKPHTRPLSLVNGGELKELRQAARRMSKAALPKANPAGG